LYGQLSHKDPARLDDMEMAIRKALGFNGLSGVARIATYRLGCGSAGLSWDDNVKPLLEGLADEFGIQFIVYHADSGGKGKGKGGSAA